MPFTLNVGLSKKIGQPDYGSLAASCHVEVELDQSLIFQDLEEFHASVSSIFAACRQAVADELARQQTLGMEPCKSGRRSSAGAAAQETGIAHGYHPASQKQLDYAQQLAGQIEGLGVPGLDALADQMFQKNLADLSTYEASRLIDSLKEIKAGRIEAAAMLQDTAA